METRESKEATAKRGRRSGEGGEAAKTEAAKNRVEGRVGEVAERGEG